MSIFYVLPPRPLLGECYASYLQSLFPGLGWASSRWPGLADQLGAVAADHPDVYVVYREDLPDNEELDQALADGFGAEAGDEIVEVRPGTRPGQLTARRWQLGSAA
jgi:hypothetical protein